MQNTELYRRGFILPLNKKAEQALDNNNVNRLTKVRYFEISNTEAFERLWEKVFFNNINYELGLMIDDYEEEKIVNSKIEKLNKTVNLFMQKTKLEPDEYVITFALENISRIAIDNKFPIYIIL